MKPRSIVSLSTAQAATKEVSSDLLNAYEIGETAYKKFKEERLESDPPAVEFKSSLKLNKLKTFTQLSQQKKS